MRKVIGIGETILDILFKDEQPTAAVPGGSVFNGIISLYLKKENSDNQKDMAELSGTYNLNSIDMNYKEELSTLNDKLKRIEQGLKNINIK